MTVPTGKPVTVNMSQSIEVNFAFNVDAIAGKNESDKGFDWKAERINNKKETKKNVTSSLSGFCCVCHLFLPLVSIFGLFPVLV